MKYHVRTTALFSGALLACLVLFGCRDPQAEHIAALRKDLESGAPQVKLRAIWTLRGIGPKADAAIPALRKILEEGDPHFRAPAAMALAGLDPQGRTVVPVLQEALRDRNHEVRAFAARALAHIGRPAAAAVTDTSTLLKDPHFMPRLMALFALWRMTGEAAHWEEILRTAQSGTLEERTLAVYLVGDSDQRDGRVVALLVRAAAAPQKPLRREAIEALAKFGPAAEPALGVLFDAFREDDEALHQPAAAALIQVDRSGTKLVPGLIAVLERGSSRAKVQSAYALGTYGNVSVPAIPALRRALKDRDPDVRGEAARTLGLLGPQATAAAPELVAMLSDRAPQPAWIAAESLAAVGSVPRGLIARAQSGPSIVRQRAFFALARVRPRTEEIRRALEAGASDRDPDVAAQAKAALESGDSAKQAGSSAGAPTTTKP